MLKPPSIAKAALCLGFFSSSLSVFAFEDRSPGIYVDGGRALHGQGHTDSLTIGWIQPWTPRQSVQGGALSFYWDVFISQWRAPLPDQSGNHNYTQVGGIANWRYRFNEGSSPWFAEAGIGLTTMNDRYRTVDREFSTRFQFTEQLSIGRSFGSRGEHEISLRYQHFSNAGIKKPNPGENFARVRYLYRF